MPKQPKVMTIAAALVKMLREAKGWSQEKLAKEAGVSKDTVSRYETGGFHLRAKLAPQILRALGVSEREFMRLEEHIRGLVGEEDIPYPLPETTSGATVSWVNEGGVPSFSPHAHLGGLWLVLNIQPPAGFSLNLTRRSDLGQGSTPPRRS
jgi:transcriptional regulator with XRE-family HTH domain